MDKGERGKGGCPCPMRGLPGWSNDMDYCDSRRQESLATQQLLRRHVGS